MRAIRLEANIYYYLDIFATKEDLKMFVFSYSSNDNVELSRRIEKISGPIKKLYRLRSCFCSLELILFFSVSFLFSRPSRLLVFNHQRAAEEAATASAAPVAKKSRKPKSAAPVEHGLQVDSELSLRRRACGTPKSSRLAHTQESVSRPIRSSY